MHRNQIAKRLVICPQVTQLRGDETGFKLCSIPPGSSWSTLFHSISEEEKTEVQRSLEQAEADLNCFHSPDMGIA